jgi:hypothetical protein
LGTTEAKAEALAYLEAKAGSQRSGSRRTPRWNLPLDAKPS